MEVKNKVVVVTGAGSGIGAAIAKLFAQHQAKVIVSDIRLGKAETICGEINAAGGNAAAFKTNVANFEEMNDLFDFAITQYGQVDVLVNNAGIGPKQLVKTADHTLEDWDNVIAVNQTGVFYGMKLALQHMMKQGAGNIVNIASLAGLKPSGNNLCYSASKYAVVGMTKSAALEYASKNIRINAVCPGYTESDLLEKLKASRPEMEEHLKSVIPMKRFGQVTEIAEAVVWLASDSTRYITGETITLDGGTSLR
ncbi:MAG: NAD(P)-dependent dehydrogenase (short-subunit alcohol dehydrogenase family) [Polaribacter sp.]|jgi:NAD(P)-dependent dehydrogenase (short-subunit alcohol dehydrogenase family)